MKRLSYIQHTLLFLISLLCLLLLLGCAGSVKTNEDGLPTKTEFPLSYPGNEYLVDYSKYGEFVEVGKEKFRYRVHDIRGLRLAAGEGVFPNIDFVRMNPLFEDLDKQGKLKGNHWEQKSSVAAQYFAWVDAPEDYGVRQFFRAKALRDGGHTLQAIKAFYAVIVHFPRSICYFKNSSSFWYVAEGARGEIEKILAANPALDVSIEDLVIRVKSKSEGKNSKDVIYVDPGKLTGKWVGLENPKGLPEQYYAKETRDKTLLELPLTVADPGTEDVVDYEKYGTFIGADGSVPYRYELKDTAGLAKAVGEGIYPNMTTIKENPLYKKYEEAGWLRDGPWAHYNQRCYALNFFALSLPAGEIPRFQFMRAEAIKEAALKQRDPKIALHAVKAYYAIAVHFIDQAVWSDNNVFIWYLSNAIWGKLKFLLEQFPELGLEIEPTYVKIINNNDFKVENDTVYVELGKIIKAKKKKPINLTSMKVVEKRGEGKVRLVKYENGHWQLLVNDKPYQVKAVRYTPTKVGESPHDNTLRNWMLTDDNNNGRPDAPYDSYIDKNKNHKQDPDEPVVGDFQLLKEMGANTIHFFHTPFHSDGALAYYDKKLNKYNSKKEFNKELLRDLYNTYGIRVIVGDLLGAYTVGSGATWENGTDYRDEEQCKKMLESVRHMVLDNKDEDYILMWQLGNENNLVSEGLNATKTLASAFPESYAKFLNRAAKMIHEIDPDHPVMVGNQGPGLLEYYNKYTPEIDVLGTNVYRGKEGFGDIFYYAKRTYDKPVIISEYGSDMVDFRVDGIVFDEESQVTYHRGTWTDIRNNMAGGHQVGNCLGGVVMEWLDEWWKSIHGPWDQADIVQDGNYPFQDGWGSEDFWGIMSQGDGFDSPYLRQPRKLYSFFKEEWNK